MSANATTKPTAAHLRHPKVVSSIPSDSSAGHPGAQLAKPFGARWPLSIVFTFSAPPIDPIFGPARCDVAVVAFLRGKWLSLLEMR